MLRLIAFAGIVALSLASCPNDCSQNGRCNQFSACLCYRNWMGADCSQRVCPFGHSFVDTPQGDLNADGRIDRPDILLLTVKTTTAVGGTAPEFPANTFIQVSPNSGKPSTINSLATSISSAVAYDDGGNWAFSIPIVLHDGDTTALDALSSTLIECASVEAGDSDVYAACDAGLTGVTAESYVSGSYTYETQFTNKNTWELYPRNHGAGKPTDTLSSFWDEGHFYAECSGKGTCDRSTGQCQCFAGYEGAGCTRTSCPNTCSGHGVCSRLTDVNDDYVSWDRLKTQTCVCDSGYTGIDCAQRICPSGDDPISRPTTLTGDSIFDQQPHAAGQEPEIQHFGHLVSLDTAVPQPFALEFTDEFGDMWVTRTMDFVTATAHDVEDALESLPNNVIQDVHVRYEFFNDVVVTSGVAQDIGALTDPQSAVCAALATSDASPSGDANCVGKPRVWAITFVANSGDVPTLGVRYSVKDTIAREQTDDAGAFNALIPCTARGARNADTAVDANVCIIATTGGIAVSSAHSVSTLGWTGIGTTSGDYFAGEDSSYDFQVEVGPDDRIVFHNTGRTGTNENELCSNRGLCDYSTGLCKCFNGFTDDDCTRQNALAMY